MFDQSHEKRRKTRAEVDQTIEVKNTLLDVPIGRVVNVSEDGFMLIGQGEIKENCLYQLSFSFTQAVNNVYHLSLGAECLWVNETDAGEQYWAGFQVIDISESDMEVFAKLADEAN